MKRLLASALILGLIAPVGLVGCGEESKEKVKETTSTPTGSTTTTTEKKIESSGSNPPPNTAGETATTPK
ncbi:MAG TPA: hypothetical protein VKP69_13650 [Isosphaeraceae bacterium]|nr:hypothetical protein [Isosphaeraceae bacterium]